MTPGTGSSSERGFSKLRKSRSYLRVQTSTTGRPLGKQTSMTSLVSSSSSESSNQSNQSHTVRSQRPISNYKMTGGGHSLPTPDLTPPGSFSGSISGSPATMTGMETINAHSCTMDILYTLTFCASALQAYHEPRIKMRALPDLDELLDNLTHCRLVISHVLGHWHSKLDKLQEDFDRTRAHMEKANALRKRVEKDIKAAFSQMDNPTVMARPFNMWTGDAVQGGMLPSSSLFGKQPRTDTASSGKTIQPEDVVEFTSYPDRTELTPTPGRMARKDTQPGLVPRRSTVKFPDTDPAEQERLLRRRRKAMDRMQAGLRNAPKILQRADEDMQCLSALFHRLQQTLAQSDEAIQAAHELAEGAITVSVYMLARRL